MNENETPKLLSVSRGLKSWHTTINYEIIEVEDGYTTSSTTLSTDAPLTADDYGKIVTAIIRARYTADDVEAIQQNYLESKTDAHKAAFNDFKAWRAFAKEKADEVIKCLEGE